MKKIKLPLEMANGVMVRTIDELKENWDLKKVVEHFVSGKLVTWLNDRYYSDIAEKIENLPKDDGKKLQQALCKAFDMPCEDVELNVDEIAERKRRKDLLRQYTSDEKILDNVDHVAFDQEEMADLLDEGVAEIYLCNNKFTIPLNVSGKKYVGVGDNVIAEIRSKEAVDFKKLGIEFENVKFDDEYQAIHVVIADKKVDFVKMRIIAEIFTSYYDIFNYNYDEDRSYSCEGHKKGIEIYQELCEKGDAKSYEALGIVYRRDSHSYDYTEGEDKAYSYSDGKPIDKEKAKFLFKESKKLLWKAVEAGNPDAYETLADMDGNFEFLQKGAELGSKKCQSAIVRAYLYGIPRFGQRKDWERAKKLAMKYESWSALYECYAFPYWPTPNFEPVRSNLVEAHKYLVKAIETGDHWEGTLSYNFSNYLNDYHKAFEWAVKGYEQEEDWVVAISCFNSLSSMNFYSRKRGYVNTMKYQEYVEARKKFVAKLTNLGLDDKCINEIVKSIPEIEFVE